MSDFYATRCPEGLFEPLSGHLFRCELRGGHDGNHRHQDREWSPVGPQLPADIGPDTTVHADGLIDAGFDAGIVDDFLGGAA